jgi:2-iminobutanoate/2-iminopropanoate deaminase
MRYIRTDSAPQAIGPYSQAVEAGDFVFLSGQIPIDPKTGEVNLFGGDVAKQTDLVISNIEAILKARGLTLENVVKATVFLSDMGNFAKVNEVYARRFGDHRPARVCVEVSKLPKDVGVEIDVIAHIER